MIKIFTFFVLLLSNVTLLEAASIIKDINLDCKGHPDCVKLKDKFSVLLDYEHSDASSVMDSVKHFCSNYNFEKVSYFFDEDKEKLTLKLNISPVIKSVNFKFVGLKLSVPKFLNTQQDNYFKSSSLIEDESLLSEYFRTLGHETIIQSSFLIKDGFVIVDFEVTTKRSNKIKSVNVESRDKLVESFSRSYFEPFLGDFFNQTLVDESITLLKKKLFEEGRYLADIKSNFINNDGHIKLNVDIRNDDKHIFIFENIETDESILIKRHLIDSIRGLKYTVDVESINTILKQYYTRKGYLNFKNHVVKNQRENTNYYRIKMFKGDRFRLGRKTFKGASSLELNSLNSSLNSFLSDNDASIYFNKEVFHQYSEVLRKKYLSSGYTSFRVVGPFIKTNYDNKLVNVEYRINEGPLTRVGVVSIFGDVEEDLKNKIFSGLTNKEQSNFDPVAFEDDIKHIYKVLDTEGYMYAELKNGEKSTVTYNNDLTKADINLYLNTGEKVKVGKIIISGNKDVKDKLILKYLRFKNGSVLNSKRIQDAQSRLVSSGLFSSVKITPLRNSGLAEEKMIVVNLKERDFGTIELAPGFRTDLGLKLSSQISYLNLFNMNRTIKLGTQINYRLSDSIFDSYRQNLDKRFIEHFTKLTYQDRFIKGTDWEFTASVSDSKRRFYSFDADITRFSLAFSRKYTDRVHLGLNYQFETIDQFNATNSIDSGSFKIGSLIPSISLDFRNNPVLPTKGAFFSVSYEVASPSFGSQDDQSLEINYTKIVSRNKFYFPIIKNKLIFASSLVLGVEKNEPRSNQAADSYIPNIRVFRLSGVDIIRGFADDEINRLSDAEAIKAGATDLSQVIVRDKAYMINLKIEPRYFLNDTMMLGVFFDAGKVSLEGFESSGMRSSAGLTFKYLTPVGSLDFDYGIKLLRKRDSSGSLESPGRLHVSIGFF